MIWVYQNPVGMPRVAAIEHLPFVWHEDPQDTKWHPAEPSPIIALMKQRRGG